MNNYNGTFRISDSDDIIAEINELLHKNLNKQILEEEWEKREKGIHPNKVIPFINNSYTAYNQIVDLIKKGESGITPEIYELTEMAIKVNSLIKADVNGLSSKLEDLLSKNHDLYWSTRYEIQIAGMLLHRGHNLSFINTSENKTPDILVFNGLSRCEIECKYKHPEENQKDYIRSIYNNTQKARKQFSKTTPGIISIDINKSNFDDFQVEQSRLFGEIERVFRNSSSVSSILLNSKVFFDDSNDFIYRHRVLGYLNKNARYPVPNWLMDNLVDNKMIL